MRVLVTDEEVSTAIRGVELAADVLKRQVNGRAVKLRGLTTCFVVDENHTYLSLGCAATEIPEFEKKYFQPIVTLIEVRHEYGRPAFQECYFSKIFHRYSPDDT